jgi:sigma-B regulation protein RsbU (phosphoserine phosphatase)
MSENRTGLQKFSEFKSRYIEDFYQETGHLYNESGAALVIYHRLRMELEVHLFWDDRRDHYSLACTNGFREESSHSEKDAEQDEVFASICRRVGYTPGEQHYYRFEVTDNVSAMLFLFGRTSVNHLRQFIDARFDLIVLKLKNAILHDRLNRHELELELLQETGEILAMSVRLEDVFQAIVQALQRLIAFDALGIFILGRDGSYNEEIFSVGYRRPNSKELLEVKAGRGLVGWAIHTGEAVIVPDVTKDPRYVMARARTKSELVIPLFSGKEVIGAFNIESDQLNAYSPTELDAASAFAHQASLSIVRARLFDEAVEQHRLRDELLIARQIQKSFLPDRFPTVPGFDFDAVNISSEEVGGDYFDVVPIVENQLGIAIADVSGHGVPASLIMASFRASLLAEIRNNYAIRVIMRKVNNLICESVKHGEFVTGVYGVLDMRNRILTFTNAGHNPPLLLRHDDRVESLREGGLPLGVLENREYEERPLHIDSGDILIFYTDGITETENEKGQHFGTERLIALVKENRNRPVREIRERIIDAVLSFRSSDRQLDDLTLMLIRAE